MTSVGDVRTGDTGPDDWDDEEWDPDEWIDKAVDEEPAAGGGGRSLLRASAMPAVGTALSRVSGLVRVAALTAALGLTNVADVYNLANTAPNILNLPQPAWISYVEAGHFDEGTAYVTVDLHTSGDMRPYAYRTTDFGKFKVMREDVLLAFMEVVEDAGTSFAFPTRTVHVVGATTPADVDRKAAPSSKSTRSRA